MKREIFISIRRCKLCGTEHDGESYLGGLNEAVWRIADCNSPIGLGMRVNPTGSHRCADGRVGVSELLGARVEERELRDPEESTSGGVMDACTRFISAYTKTRPEERRKP